MTVPDLKLTKTPLFESVSVTAQHWVDLHEVSVGSYVYMRSREEQLRRLIDLRLLPSVIKSVGKQAESESLESKRSAKSSSHTGRTCKS